MYLEFNLYQMIRIVCISYNNVSNIVHIIAGLLLLTGWLKRDYLTFSWFESVADKMSVWQM